MSMIFALAKLAETRDDETGRHLERVQIICRMLAEKLCENHQERCDFDENYINRIFYAARCMILAKLVYLIEFYSNPKVDTRRIRNHENPYNYRFANAEKSNSVFRIMHS